VNHFWSGTGGWAVGTAAVLLLAACSGGGSGAAGTSSTGAAAGSGTASGPTGPSAPSASSDSSGSSGSSPAGPASAASGGSGTRACQAAELAVSTGQGGAAAGSVYLPVVFLNRGTTTCTLHGYPGVAGLDAAGHQLTQAVREPMTAGTITLTPGQSASALVHAGDIPIGTATSCPADYAGLLVTPPNTTTSIHLTAKLPSCDGLSVRPVVAGTTGM
jgi:hypothetical protein